jgi:hypothetical protein
MRAENAPDKGKGKRLPLALYGRRGRVGYRKSYIRPCKLSLKLSLSKGVFDLSRKKAVDIKR